MFAVKNSWNLHGKGAPSEDVRSHSEVHAVFSLVVLLLYETEPDGRSSFHFTA